MKESDHQQSKADDGGAEIELRSGAVRVRPASRELKVDGVPVAIERRAFDLLVHLMRNADRVVEKDELLREVWRSRPVSESTVAQAASRVRRALGGEPDEWIVTAYGVGYRFIGPVTSIEDGHVRDERAPRAQRRDRPVWPRRLLVPALTVALAVLLVSAWVALRNPAESELRIAVLPVQNETGDAQLDWVELGVLPLIDRALEEGGVRRVQTGRVLSTLRRYPEARDSQSQARVLRLNTSADRVLVPKLYVADGGYRFEIRSADASGPRYELDLQGDDVTVLAVAAGTRLSQSLARWQGAERARRSLVTDDPFINQAFARGLDARLRGQWEDAARYFDTVLAAAPELLDAKYHLALVTRRLGDWDYTEQLHRELLDAARDRDDQGLLAAVQSISGTLAWRRGDRDQAEQWYLQALDNYREQENADYIASTTANLGILAATRAEYALAEQRMRQALIHYQSSGDRVNEAQTRKNIGQLLVDQGRLDEAARELERSLEIRRTLELPLEVALTLSSLADIDMARGQWRQALAHHQSVLDTAREYNSPTLEAQAAGDLSTVLRRLGRLNQARTVAADAYRVATELGSPSNQAFALLQQGRAEHDLGHWQRAVDLFDQSRALYSEIEQPLGAELARIACVESLIEANRGDEAAVMLDAAARQVEDSELTRLAPGLARVRARLARTRGKNDAALTAQREAYRLAASREALIERLDYGGELGLLLLESGADPAELEVLAMELAPRAEVSAPALAFLASFHRDRDPDRALILAERRRGLIGEGWSPADERELKELRERAGVAP